EVGRIAAGQVEESQVCRSVIQEAGEHTGQPEISGVDRLSVGTGHQSNHRSKSTGGTCAQHFQNWDDRYGNTEEQFADFQNRFPREVVGLAVLFLRENKRKNCCCRKDSVANKGFKCNVQTEEVIFDACLPETGHEHGTHDTGKKNEINGAFETERNVGDGLLEFFVVFKFFLV